MEQVRHEPACWPDGFYHLLFVLVHPGTPASHFGGKYAGPKCSNVSKAATVATIYATGHENRHDFFGKPAFSSSRVGSEQEQIEMPGGTSPTCIRSPFRYYRG